jgi:uncharacterized protein
MLVAAGLYLWWRLVIGTTRARSVGRRVGTVVAVIVVLLGPTALIAQYALPISHQRVIGWPGWLGYALVVFLVTVTLLTEPVRMWWWWRRRKSTLSRRSTQAAAGPPPAPERRLFLQRAMAAAIGATAVVATGVGARSAVGGPAVRTVTIPIVGIPRDAVGMRIALVSDLTLAASPAGTSANPSLTLSTHNGPTSFFAGW